MSVQPDQLLRRLFDAAVRAVSAETRVPPALPQPPKGRTVVVGAGKAAASMAKAVEEHWSGPLSGLIVTRYGHGVPTRHIEVREAGHPLPDAAGTKAAEHILELASGLGPDDLLLCLISGGGSALLALPAPGLTLEDKRRVGRDLLHSGATISEMNCVRRHLSAIKGGRLALAAHPARVVSLLVSDVPGDDPTVIASGPTVPDPTTLADARAVLARYGIDPPDAVRRHLENPASETPKPGDPRLAGAEAIMIAKPLDALEAAAAEARAAGITPLILGDSIEGEAREVGRALAGMALSCAWHGHPLEPPCVLLSGGETTVTVRGQGRGGRNAECALGMALGLAGAPNIHAIAGDTDGIDGTEDNAGALIGPETLARARAAGLDPQAMLGNNDAYGLFAALGDLVVTGPTLTNVNDFRALLVSSRQR
ncbi:MAG TPA: glycerate kinase [Azospirillum sp.]|nr:glycerate kinase [Azospirillum sp.]